MASARDMRIRIRSVKNLSQVTRALQTVSASKVRKSVQAVTATQPYSEKAWEVLIHLASQPGHKSLHPLLAPRDHVNNTLVILMTGDRGLAGSYNVNIVRHTLDFFNQSSSPVSYVTVGKKGRDMLIRRQHKVLAEFSGLSNVPKFIETSQIGYLAVDSFLNGEFDEVYIAYTQFISMLNHKVVVRKILPLDVAISNYENEEANVTLREQHSVFIYEPGQTELLDEIVPRFTALQIYQAILSAQASENAARMMAMQNATENAIELVSLLQLEYNNIRQQSITNEMIDINGGVEALAN
ncbi:MAG: ATP synthase F1 subunit gamma [Anaerolineaceae bacterium]|jgi:F-type H+-transporting ATPase subunit gamma